MNIFLAKNFCQGTPATEKTFANATCFPYSVINDLPSMMDNHYLLFISCSLFTDNIYLNTQTECVSVFNRS